MRRRRYCRLKDESTGSSFKSPKNCQQKKKTKPDFDSHSLCCRFDASRAVGVASSGSGLLLRVDLIFFLVLFFCAYFHYFCCCLRAAKAGVNGKVHLYYHFFPQMEVPQTVRQNDLFFHFFFVFRVLLGSGKSDLVYDVPGWQDDILWAAKKKK